MCCESVRFQPQTNIPMPTPKATAPMTAPKFATAKTTAPGVQQSGGLGGGFSLQGIGSLVSAVGGILAYMDQSAYRKEMLKMEKDRIKRDRKRQDEFDAGMDKAYG